MSLRGSRLTIVVTGMVAAVPYQGGATWAVLQYLLGFRQLGHDIYFIEPLSEVDLRPHGASLADSTNARYFGEVTSEFGLGSAAALLLEGSRETVGLSYRVLEQIARRSDLLINISGRLSDPALVEPIPLRVYLDLDPAFNQLWQAAQGIDRHFAGHTHHVTVGPAIGDPACPVPTHGFEWLGILPPVVLDAWPVAERIESDAFTTVANWRGYGSIEHGGIFYGQKVHSLRRFISLPRRSQESFHLALAIHPDEERDLAALAENGWRLVDPAEVAGTPRHYRRFIQGSRAELGIAKSGYVAARCGWFSDRSACYLASGRPVLAQETGFSRYLPVGEGLVAFTTIDDALGGLEAVRRDYPRHSRVARALAAEYLDAKKVLTELLRKIGAAP